MFLGPFLVNKCLSSACVTHCVSKHYTVKCLSTLVNLFIGLIAELENMELS